MKTSYLASSILAVILASTELAAGQATVVQTTTTSSAGTITEFSPDSLVIRSETAPQPIRYVYRKTTTYVDEAGNPVSMEVVKSGLPVTVQYVREDGQLVASRVIVRRVVAPAAPVIEEKKTTTTTTTIK